MSADDRTPMQRAMEMFADLGGTVPAEQLVMPLLDEMMDTPSPACKVHNAKLVVKHKPQQAALALFLLSSGEGINSVASATKLGNKSVIALRDMFAEKVTMQKERLAQMCDDAAALQVERLLDNPEAVKIDNAAMTAKLLRDTSAQLRGDAPPVQRHVHTVLTADDLREMATGMGLAGAEFSALPAVSAPHAVRDSESLSRHCIDANVTTYPHTKAGGEGVSPTLPGGGSADALPAS